MDKLTTRLLEEIAVYVTEVFGWENGQHTRHTWWREQQTGHVRCAYCHKHPWEV